MPVQVICPHCRTPCLVAEQHLGVPVQCGRCGRAFTTRTDSVAAQLVRLDVGGASPGQVCPGNENSFLVQHLSWCNLDGWHELAALVIANDVSDVAAALAPLLNKVLNGTPRDAAGVPEAIAAALRKANAVVVISDGQVHIDHAGDCRVYHQRAARLVQITHPLKLAAGDRLFVTCDSLDAAGLGVEIAKASASAVQLAQQLVERSDGPIIAVRCY